MRKDVIDMRPSDFAKFPVWEFDLAAESRCDTMLMPVRALPVDDLANRVVGTTVRLANATLIPALLGNIDLRDPSATEQFLALSLFLNGAWWHLARYFDPGYPDVSGPHALAAALKLPLDAVFPISYDLRNCCTGHPLAVTGSIVATPPEKLPRDEIIRRAAS